MAIKKVIIGEEARHKLLEGVDMVAEVVSSTLGPRANVVAIERPWGVPAVIGDGVGVAKEIELEDRFANIGAQLTIEASQKTNDQVGDGTSVTCVLVQALVKEGFKNIAAGANSMMIRLGMEKALAILVKEIDLKSKKINDDEEIRQVATISAQNEEVGQIVANAIKKLGKDALISVEEGATTETEVEYKEGMEFDRGFISPYFMTDQALGEASLDNPYILVTDKTINNVQEFLPFLEKFAKTKKDNNNLVIIAEDVSGDPLGFLVINKVKGNLPCIAIKAPGFGDKRRATLEDIAILTGAWFISNEAGDRLDNLLSLRQDSDENNEQFDLAALGRASRVTAGKGSTLIIGGKGNPAQIKSRIEHIKKALDGENNEFEHEKLQERLAKLTSGVAIISVGAEGEPEMKELKERVIDAVAATKAALEEGIVPGGETTLIRASEALAGLELPDDEQVGVKIVQSAVREPFKRLMLNSGYEPGQRLAELDGLDNWGIDVLDGNYKDMIKAGIIDPAKVVKSALANAVSIAKSLLTTKTIIVEVKDKKDDKTE